MEAPQRKPAGHQREQLLTVSEGYRKSNDSRGIPRSLPPLIPRGCITWLQTALSKRPGPRPSDGALVTCQRSLPTSHFDLPGLTCSHSAVTVEIICSQEAQQKTQRKNTRIIITKEEEEEKKPQQQEGSTP